MAAGLQVVPEFDNPGVLHPDIPLKHPGEPTCALVDLKHPTKNADPRSWKVHGKRQHGRFKALPCWAAADFVAIHLLKRDRRLLSRRTHSYGPKNLSPLK